MHSVPVAQRTVIALTRGVSPALARCELTHLPRMAIDLDLARAQHAAYERALATLGCVVVGLPAAPDMPDSVFVEDVAFVLDEMAIIARPGAQSRRLERAAVEEALAGHRPLARIEAPATLDGGDVLVVGRSIFIGLSTRTNEAAVEQVRGCVAPHGYTVHPVRVAGCLHLKSAVTVAGPQLLLMNPAWAPVSAFSRFDVVDVDADEPHAANVVRVGERLLFPSAYPRTRKRLEDRGLHVTTVDVSEFSKAEGAVTCCSLIFESGVRQGSVPCLTPV